MSTPTHPPKSHIALQRQAERHNAYAAFGGLLLVIAIILALVSFNRTEPRRPITPGSISRELVYVTRPPEYRTVVVTATTTPAPYYAGVPDSYSITPLPYSSPTPTPSARLLSAGPVTGGVEVK